jgi:hypothetical protein
MLALHYRVYGTPFSEDFYPRPSNNDGLYQLLLELAGELYPAFKKPPPKGGRPRKYQSGLLVDYPDAHAARLAQLFALEKQRRLRQGDPARTSDICGALVRRYSGKYPRWQYNDLKTASSLERRWQKISPAIKQQPEKFLPADGSEPTWFDWRYLPPLPPDAKN